MLRTSINSSVLFLVLCVTGCINNAKYSSFDSVSAPLAGKALPITSQVGLSVANPQYYLVKPSDTLYSIAFRFGLDYKKLAVWNKIDSSYRIYEGQSLSLEKQVTHAKSTNNQSVSTGGRSTNTPIKSVTKSNSQNNGAPSPVKTSPYLPKVSWNWPHLGKIVRTFSHDMSTQKGIDINGQIGDSVVAATSGIVVYAGNGLPGYGNLIIVEHSNSFLSAYAFAEKILVKEKDNIRAGQQIATMGKQGDQPGLHFEIRQNGKPVDPLKFLPKR